MTLFLTSTRISAAEPVMGVNMSVVSFTIGDANFVPYEPSHIAVCGLSEVADEDHVAGPHSFGKEQFLAVAGP
jgi:hypothetical protein